MRADEMPFGDLPDGRQVHRYVLRHADVQAAVVTYGAILQSVLAPDAEGGVDEVTLGYDDLDGYLGDSQFFGAVVGRFANRIAQGRFDLDGVQYELPRNHGTSCLHGGPQGFSTKLWSAREVDGGVELGLTSPDGDMGFPGRLDVTVTYTLDDAGLTVRYEAVSDAPTVVNLTNHAYWNLDGRGTVEDHRLQLLADRFVAVDSDLVPTGELADVAGTPMDFRAGRRIGDRLRDGDPQLGHASGYDHAWVLAEPAGDVRAAARLSAGRSGRTLEVLTDQPSVQFYSGNFLDGNVVGRGGSTYRQTDGLCLETQHLPDSPNQPEFPSTVLRPGERFASTTVFRVGATCPAA